jgi:hypothetical protein
VRRANADVINNCLSWRRISRNYWITVQNLRNFQFYWEIWRMLTASFRGAVARCVSSKTAVSRQWCHVRLPGSLDASNVSVIVHTITSHWIYFEDYCRLWCDAVKSDKNFTYVSEKRAAAIFSAKLSYPVSNFHSPHRENLKLTYMYFTEDGLVCEEVIQVVKMRNMCFRT